MTNIIADTNIADETTKDIIIRGYEITKEAAQKLNLPVKYAVSAFDADFGEEINNKLFKIERRLFKI